MPLTKVKASNITTGEVITPSDNISTLTNDAGYLTDITGKSIKNLSDVYTSMSPTDGQVLTYDTTNGWQAEDAGGAGLEFIATADASSSSSLDFTAFDATKYDGYMFVLANVRPLSYNAVFKMITSSNGGSTWDNSSSQYGYKDNYGSSINAPAMYAPYENASYVVGSAYQGISGSVFIPGPHLSNYTMATWNLTFQNHASYVDHTVGGGFRKSTAAVNGIRFSFSGVSVYTGTITMYGLKNA